MTHRSVIAGTLACLVFRVTAGSFGGEYYVAPHGRAENPGTLSRPWSLAKANASLRPGDTAVLRGGVYRTPIAPARSGNSAQSRIVYKAYGREEPVIDFGEPLKGWTKCAVSDPMNRPDPDTWTYETKHWGKGSRTFPNGHFGGNYRALDGVDAIYRIRCDKEYFIVEDDCARAGRDWMWWHKRGGSRQIRMKEFGVIVETGEYLLHKGWLYARASDSRSPDTHDVRGIPRDTRVFELAGRRYVTIERVCGRNVHTFASTADSSYITLQGCRLQYANGYAGLGLSGGAHHWVVRDCLIEGVGCFDSHRGNAVQLEGKPGPHHNLFEGCTIAWGGHCGLQMRWSPKNIVRQCLFRDSARNMGIYFRSDEVLIEDNRFTRSSSAGDLAKQHATDHPHLAVTGCSHAIVRRNRMWAGTQLNLCARTKGTHAHNCTSNAVYQNTIYGNVPDRAGGISFSWNRKTEAVLAHNQVLNNIVFENRAGDLNLGVRAKELRPVNTMSHNVFGDFGDPKGVAGLSASNIVGSNPMIAEYVASRPDFRLREGSPCIDTGTFLTRTSSAGAAPELAVNDAWFFTAGHGIVPADRVQLQGQRETARVVGVDLERNVLKLDRPMRWTKGQGVSLPYAGKAPDIGACEFDGRTLVSGMPVDSAIE